MIKQTNGCIRLMSVAFINIFTACNKLHCMYLILNPLVNKQIIKQISIWNISEGYKPKLHPLAVQLVHWVFLELHEKCEMDRELLHKCSIYKKKIHILLLTAL